MAWPPSVNILLQIRGQILGKRKLNLSWIFIQSFYIIFYVDFWFLKPSHSANITSAFNWLLVIIIIIVFISNIFLQSNDDIVALSVFIHRYLKNHICHLPSLYKFYVLSNEVAFILQRNFSGLAFGKVLWHRNTIVCVLSDAVALFFMFPLLFWALLLGFSILISSLTLKRTFIWSAIYFTHFNKFTYFICSLFRYILQWDLFIIY